MKMARAILILLFVSVCLGGLFAQKAMETTMKNPDELYEYAAGLYSRKFYDMALVEQNKFLNLYPDDKRVKEIMVMRINTLRFLGKVDEMVAMIREYSKTNPNSKHLEGMYYTAGTVLFNGKKYSEAAEFLSKLDGAKDLSIRESAAYFLAKCLYELGEKEKSLAQLKALADKELAKEHTDRVFAAYEYAEALYHSGHAEESLAYYGRLANVAGLDAAMLEQVLYRRGVIYYQLGKSKEALQAFEAYILRFPDGPNAKTVRKCRIAVIWDGKSSTAEKTLELAKDWRQRYPDAADWDMDEILACSLMLTGNYDEAIPYFERLHVNPAVPADRRRYASFNLVCCLMNAGHYADAEAKAASYLAEYPNTSNVGDVLNIYSQVLIEQGKNQEAVEALKKEMAFFNEDQEHWRNTGYRLVNVYAKLGDNVSAAALLRGMSKRLPGEEKWYSLMRAAGFELKAGRTAESKADFIVIAESKEFPSIAREAMRSLLQFALNEKDFPSVLIWVEKLLQGAPDAERGSLLYLRASTLYNMNEMEMAEKQLQDILGMQGISEKEQLNAKVLLTSIYFFRQEYAKAIPLLDSIFQHEHLDDLLSMGFLNLAGEAYISVRNWEAAEGAFKRILESTEATPEERMRVKSKIARCIRNIAGRLPEAEKLFNEVLQNLDGNVKLQESISFSEVLSMLAEVELELKKYDFAAIHAERALYKADDDHIHARSLYVLAQVKLVAKDFEAANRYATQCFILMDDEVYSPMAMSISAKAFKGLGQDDRARQVLYELGSKYPKWLAQHPEAK
ncbi:MAG: tetratricopeptide repeat protein [Victivallales bacterium]|nr:tetratricopeptide repeat protein [Victivallales bacterium]